MARSGLWLLVSVVLLISFLQEAEHASVIAAEEDAGRPGPLTFAESYRGITLGNDRIRITVGKGGKKGLRGSIRSLVYTRDGGQNIELLQTTYDKEKDKFPGYWDMHWYDGSPTQSRPRNQNSKCSFGQANRTVLTEAGSPSMGSPSMGTEDQMLGVTYEQEMKENSRKSTPVDTLVDYSVRKDIAGVYCTLLVDHTRFDPAMLLTELRLVLMLNPKFFDYSYVSDDRQRFMPTRRDISRHSSSKLAFKEARLITKPEDKTHSGEVDHKYIHSVETKDASLYGWISTELGVGIWIISPNKWEYLGGGPTKQELSVQTGPKLLAMLHSRHYGTPSIDLEDGEEWEKVFGPFLIYVNEAPSTEELILDAKARAAEEARSWPYKWVPFPSYKSHGGRGIVVGQVVRQEASNSDQRKTAIPGVWMGLVDETSSTSNWEDEVKKYQFWNTTNEDGEFAIYNVRPGKYILQSVVRGFLADSSVLQVVTVEENWVSNVGEIIVRPVQKGPIVWEIGYPDRSAAEFMIPPELHTSLGTGPTSTLGNEFRQYGLWEKFWELYPNRDPVFRIGVSDWTKDWYFAHVLRLNNRTSPREPAYRTTQREIVFAIDGPEVVEGNYTLRIAIAGAHQAALEIRVNNPDGSPLFDTGPFGNDNALARAGIHGHYHEFSIGISHMNLRVGQNSIFLTQRRSESRFNYVMYDYLRLEAPAPTTPTLQGFSSVE